MFPREGYLFVPTNQFRGYIVLAGRVELLAEVPLGLDPTHRVDYPRPLAATCDNDAERNENTTDGVNICESMLQWLETVQPQCIDRFGQLARHWKALDKFKTSTVEYDYNSRSHVLVREYVSGEFVGEEELLGNRPFTCSILAKEKSLILFVDRSLWSRLRESEYCTQRSQLISTLTKSSVIPPDAITPSLTWGSMMRFKRGHIFAPSQPVFHIHIIIRGRCTVLKPSLPKSDPQQSQEVKPEAKLKQALPFVVTELDGSGCPELLGYSVQHRPGETSLHSFGNPTNYYFKVNSEFVYVLRIPRILFDNILIQNKPLIAQLLSLKSVRESFYTTRTKHSISKGNLITQITPQTTFATNTTTTDKTNKTDEKSYPLCNVTRPEYEMMFQMNRRAKVAAILERDSPEKFGGILDPFRKKSKRVASESVFQIRAEDLVKSDSKQRGYMVESQQQVTRHPTPVVAANQIFQNSFLLDASRPASRMGDSHLYVAGVRPESQKSKGLVRRSAKELQSLKTLSRLYANPMSFSGNRSNQSIFQIGASGTCYGRSTQQADTADGERRIGGFRFKKTVHEAGIKNRMTDVPASPCRLDSSGRYYSSLLVELDLESNSRIVSSSQKRLPSGRLQYPLKDKALHFRQVSLGKSLQKQCSPRLLSGLASSATTDLGLVVQGEQRRPPSTSVAFSKVSRFLHNSGSNICLD